MPIFRNSVASNTTSDINNGSAPATHARRATAHFTGNFEFYEDEHFRFEHNAGHFRIASVATAKSIGVYGLNSSSTNASLPIGSDPDAQIQGGYGSPAVNAFLQISNQGISTDYDDIQIFWIECANISVSYVVRIQGGNTIKALVERYDYTVMGVNQKITLGQSFTLRTLNSGLLNGVNPISQINLQNAYNAEIGSNAPDVIPAQVNTAANALASSSYKIYLGHTQWWYTNTSSGISNASWTVFGGNKADFGAAVPTNHIFTFK